MKTEHAEWIAAYVARQPSGFVRGKCAEATLEMVATFPDLRRVGGFVHVDWGRDQHFWCIAPDGSVVDPTASQFEPIGVFEYEELDLDDPATRDLVPTGKCMDCGSEIYGGKDFCNDDCAEAFGDACRRGMQL